jgi:hypothetical protein
MLYNARRTLREHQQQLLHDDGRVVVRRLCADIRHAQNKHPNIAAAVTLALLRGEKEKERESSLTGSEEME